MESKLHWLAPRRQAQSPVTFGHPWPRQALRRGQLTALRDEQGNSIPVQTKTTAYWPDGSVKWTAHSAVLDTAPGKSYEIKPADTPVPSLPQGEEIRAEQAEDGIVTVESGLLSCRVTPHTHELFSGLTRKKAPELDCRPISARLIGYIENVEKKQGMETHSLYKLTGITHQVTLEESGPVRAVVKIEGCHEYDMKKAQIFPFVVRLYFYAGSDEVRMVHSFVFNANEQTDFLKGLAVELTLTASGEGYNRHVGFVGETGMWYEALQPMYVGGGIWGRKKTARPESGEDERLVMYRRQQQDGQFVTLDKEEYPEFAEVVEDNALFSDFRLSQPSCENYTIVKRTHPDCAYITAAQGTRSGGAVFFGSRAGVIAAGIRDFWQKLKIS